MVARRKLYSLITLVMEVVNQRKSGWGCRTIASFGKVENTKRNILRGGAVVARKAHNLEVVGSIPTPATRKK